MMAVCFEIDQHSKHESRLYALPRGYPRTYLTKCPGDVLIADLFLPWVRRLHVIVMVRDPRDIVVSRHRARPDRYWAGLRYWKDYLPYVRKLQGHRRVSVVRYEDLVRDPDRVQDRLREELPFLTYCAAFSEFHRVSRASVASREALGGLRPVSRASIGNWRKHKPRLAGQLKIHGPITEQLIEFGYEKDSSWLRELDGVKPDLSASHWPEYFSPGELKARRKEASRRVPKVVVGHSVAYRTMRRGYRGLRRRVRSGFRGQP
jgi:hypothetical protein